MWQLVLLEMTNYKIFVKSNSFQFSQFKFSLIYATALEEISETELRLEDIYIFAYFVHPSFRRSTCPANLFWTSVLTSRFKPVHNAKCSR